MNGGGGGRTTAKRSKCDGRDIFFNSIHRNDLRTLKVFLSLNADLDIQNDDGETPLNAACRLGNRRLAKLLTTDSNINIADKDCMTPLHWAAKLRDAALAKLLLQRGADPNALNVRCMTPLYCACVENNGKTAKLLITEQNVNFSDKMMCPNSPLVESARLGNWQLAEALLQNGASVNWKAGPFDHTPLSCAVNSGSVKTLIILLRYGPDVSNEIFHGGNVSTMLCHNFYTLLQQSILREFYGITFILVEYGYPLNKEDWLVKGSTFGGAARSRWFPSRVYPWLRSRLTGVRSLKSICRSFLYRKRMLTNIDQLFLPTAIKGYLNFTDSFTLYHLWKNLERSGASKIDL